MLTRLGGMKNITMPNFVFKTGLSKAEMLRFFDFPNGRRRYLLCLKSPNFLANGVQRIKTHGRVKFWKNRPISCEVLRFFKFSKWRTMPSWNSKFVKFHRQTVSGRPRLIIVLNIVRIGRLVVETLHFFEFSKWPLPPSWIFEIAKFYWLLGREGRDTSACHTLSQSVNRL